MFFIAEICILTTYACSLVLPLNLSKFTDEVISAERFDLIGTVVASYVVIFVVSLIVNLIYSHVWQSLYNGYVVDVKCDVFESVMSAKAENLNNLNSGDVMERIESDADQFIEAVLKNGFHFINSIIMCIGILTIIAGYNVWISILILLATAIPTLFTRLFASSMEKYSKSHRETYGKLTSILFDYFDGRRELRLQNVNKSSTKNIKDYLERLIGLGNALKRIDLYMDKTSYFLNLSISVVIYAVSVNLIGKSLLSVGEFLAIIAYMALLHKKLNWILRIALSWRSRKVSIDRIEQMLTLPKEDRVGTEITSIENIFFKNVSFGYNETTVLLDISFNIKKGEKLAIVGVSGVGKTTLIGLLLKLYTAKEGNLYINGEDILKLNPVSVRKRCCVVSQEIMLFDTSIRHNLTLGVNTLDEKIWNTLEIVGLKEVIEQLPNGLDFVFSRGGDLSGGQKQRLMIARAVLKDADLYILDEATSALDTKNEKTIIDELVFNNILKTAIIISHRYNAVKNCGKVLVLKDGKTECFCDTIEIREKSPEYNLLFPKEEVLV